MPGDQLLHKPDLVLPRQEVALRANGNACATFFIFFFIKKSSKQNPAILEKPEAKRLQPPS